MLVLQLAELLHWRREGRRDGGERTGEEGGKGREERSRGRSPWEGEGGSTMTKHP